MIILLTILKCLREQLRFGEKKCSQLEVCFPFLGLLEIEASVYQKKKLSLP